MEHYLISRKTAAAVTLAGLLISAVPAFADEADTTPPSVTLYSAEPDPTASATIPVTATFSEEVTGFGSDDIVADHASITNFTQTGTTTYTFDLAVSGDATTTVTATIDEHKFQDVAGNENAAQTVFSRVFDPSASSTGTTTQEDTAPTITITEGPADDEDIPTADASTTEASISFAFTSDQASSTFECSLVGTSSADSFYGCGSPQEFTLPIGDYRFAIQASGPDGSTASTSRTFSIVQGTPPADDTPADTNTDGSGSSSAGSSNSSASQGGGTQIVGSSPTAPSGAGTTNGDISGHAVIPTAGPSNISTAGNAVIPTLPPAVTQAPEPQQPASSGGDLVIAGGSALVPAPSVAAEPEESVTLAQAEALPEASTTNNPLAAAAAQSGAAVAWWVWALVALIVLAFLAWWAYRQSSA